MISMITLIPSDFKELSHECFATITIETHSNGCYERKCIESFVKKVSNGLWGMGLIMLPLRCDDIMTVHKNNHINLSFIAKVKPSKLMVNELDIYQHWLERISKRIAVIIDGSFSLLIFNNIGLIDGSIYVNIGALNVISGMEA